MADNELQPVRPPNNTGIRQAVTWYSGLPVPGRIMLSLVGFGSLFAAGTFFFSQFTQARNIVSNLDYSRVMLGGLFVILALMFLLVVSQVFRNRFWVWSLSIVLPAVMVLGLDWWAPKPKVIAASIVPAHTIDAESNTHPPLPQTTQQHSDSTPPAITKEDLDKAIAKGLASAKSSEKQILAPEQQHGGLPSVGNLPFQLDQLIADLRAWVDFKQREKQAMIRDIQKRHPDSDPQLRNEMDRFTESWMRLNFFSFTGEGQRGTISLESRVREIRQELADEGFKDAELDKHLQDEQERRRTMLELGTNFLKLPSMLYPYKEPYEVIDIIRRLEVLANQLKSQLSGVNK